MRERRRFLLVWAVVLGAGGIAVATLGRYGAHVVAFGLLYAALATSWSWLRAAGLFSFGQAAFFGTGALTQAWLVAAGRASPWLALCASAAAGALAAVPLIPGLRLSPPSFGLATLAYAVLLKALASNVPAFGMEGFLLPATPGFDGPAAPVVVMLAVLGSRPRPRLRGVSRPAERPRRRRPSPVARDDAQPGHRPRRGALAPADRERGDDRGGGRSLRPPRRERRDRPSSSRRPSPSCRWSWECSEALSTRLADWSERSLFTRSTSFSSGPPFRTRTRWPMASSCAACFCSGPRDSSEPGRRGFPLGAARGRSLTDPSPWPFASLTVRRNGTTVLRDVSFAVEPGQILRVLGPNGAGKTSLLLAIAGRLPAARGAILLGGIPSPRGAAARARRGLGRTFQAPRPFPEWTVRENVASRRSAGEPPAEVDELLQELDLSALSDRPAGQLSVGEGKRLELARVLALEPARPAPRRAPGRAQPGRPPSAFPALIERRAPRGRSRRLGRAWPGRRRPGEPAPRPRGRADPFPRVASDWEAGARGAVVTARLVARELTGGYPGGDRLFGRRLFGGVRGDPDGPGRQRLRKIRAARDSAGPSGAPRRHDPSRWRARAGPRAGSPRCTRDESRLRPAPALRGT